MVLSISSKLGNERSLDFWIHRWLGSYSFDALRPSLFWLCGPGGLKVGDALVWINESREWNLGVNGRGFE